MKVALVSCVKSKLNHPAPARDLYTSTLFREQRQLAESTADAWYILSAEHGVVEPSDVLAPYEKTLNRMRRAERDAWSTKVLAQLERQLPPRGEIIFLAGERYREGLIPVLESRGYVIEIPLEGLPFGKQLQRLKELNAAAITQPEVGALDRFYGLLKRLASLPGQGRRLGDYTGRSGWPGRGVYFFREPGEFRKGGREPRVVRVGTHAVSAGSKSTLWGRLRTHRGARDGSGNHRGSIFRLHTGRAVLARDGATRPTSWGIGQNAPREVRLTEVAIEQRVSEYLGRMSVLWLAVPDDPSPSSDRSVVEKNTIALLSNSLRPHDPPSPNWLGHHSDRSEIRESGLWNLNYVTSEFDPASLDVFEYWLERMTAGDRVQARRRRRSVRPPT